MTPPPTPDDPGAEPLDDDELAVHAVLDGEATADERRRVARDPRLRARLEELRATAAAVAPTPPAAEADLARIRATAIAALATDPAAEADDGEVDDADAAGVAADDDPGGPSDGDEEPAGDPAVVPLTTRRPRRLPPLPAVAAVVLVLLVVGVGLIATGRGDDGDTSATQTAAESRADEATEEAGDATSGGAASPEADAAPSTTLPEGTRTFASDDDLRVVLQEVDPTSLDALAPPPPADDAGGSDAGDATASAAETEDGARCGSVLQASDSAIGEVQAVALVEVDGTPLVVLSTPVEATAETPASTRLTVLEAASCVPRFAVQRDP
ncbi:hypothetical protein PO878_21645 [Iamia majanohamensis]|uniref:Uncharacterized protein n=1 Tax=Iamia majanohamensis TaxID=467976 RepID=A0AAE9Y7H4_9ACTN|nr:hypothetical protein [Iamia majanohamensis]WCO67096.1 hypothetical protein PO878_21645 [Iamia majanohamensis]